MCKNLKMVFKQLNEALSKSNYLMSQTGGVSVGGSSLSSSFEFSTAVQSSKPCEKHYLMNCVLCSGKFDGIRLRKGGDGSSSNFR